jgi:hypothetical protein
MTEVIRPAYPGLNTVAVKKSRQAAAAAGSVRDMDPTLARNYGEAVLDAIRKLQRSEIMSVLTPLPAPYRGNNRQIGEAVLRRVRGQQQARLLSAPSRVTDKNRQALYDEAMAEKRGKPVYTDEPIYADGGKKARRSARLVADQQYREALKQRAS